MDGEGCVSGVDGCASSCGRGVGSAVTFLSLLSATLHHKSKHSVISRILAMIHTRMNLASAHVKRGV